jgi:hypothetical protein
MVPILMSGAAGTIRSGVIAIVDRAGSWRTTLKARTGPRNLKQHFPLIKDRPKGRPRGGQKSVGILPAHS